LLPAALLVYRIQGDAIVPAFLGTADLPWVRALIDERARFVGRPRRELAARLREPLPVASPPRRRALVAHVLDRLAQPRRRDGTSARDLRAEVFTAAATGDVGRSEVVAEAAARRGVAAAARERALFADLPGEQPVTAAPRVLSPVEVVAEANLALARGLVARTDRLRIAIDGNALPVVRIAKLRGLIVSVERGAEAQVVLDVSGPLALFHHTRLYGRALGELLPTLAWSAHYALEGVCRVSEGPHLLRLATGDPIAPSIEPRRYDSALEEGFVDAIGRAALEWEVIRDPHPLIAGSGLAFPDFALVHREDPSRRWLVEIVGFWTPDYLARKLAAYRAASAPNLILCLDERRRCSDGELPPGARIVWFRRRIDPQAVLDAIREGRPVAPAYDAALLAAIKEVAAASRYGNAFVRLIERTFGRRVSVADLLALCRAGHIALDRPTADLAARPLDPPRPPIPVGDAAARLPAVVANIRRSGRPPLYRLVREHFEWLAPDGRDQFRPVIDALARAGVVTLGESRGRITIEAVRPAA